VDKWKIKPNSGNAIGQAMHSLQKKMLIRKLAGLPMSSEEQAIETALFYLDYQIKTEGLRLNKKERVKGLEKVRQEMELMVKRLSIQYRLKIFPLLNPISDEYIEQGFYLNIPGYKYRIKLYPDSVEDGLITDLKILGKKQSSFDQSIQAALYSLWTFAHFGSFYPMRFDVLTKKKKDDPEYHPVTVEHDWESTKPIYWMMENFEKTMESGIFRPSSRSGWWCGSEDACGYFSKCPAMFRKQFAVTK
jgi:hypothetical protein